VIYAIVKNKEEQQILDQEIKETKNKGWYRRLMLIKLSSQGELIRHLKKEFGICEATIRSYIHSYNQGGLDGLRPKKPTGRPPKIAHWSKKDWGEIMELPPSQYEKLNTHSDTWTLDLMVKYLMEYHQIKVCISSIHNSLRRTQRHKTQSVKDFSKFELQTNNTR
jgi:transposase